MVAYLQSLMLMVNTLMKDIDFTFEDFKMPESFTLLAGMR
jgi:hypothetical protein